MWDWQEHHIACLNHVINLAVQDFIRGLKGMKKKPKGGKETEDEVEDEDSGEDGEEEEEKDEEDDSEDEEAEEDVDEDDVVVVGEAPDPRKAKKSLAQLLKNDPRNPNLQITLAKVQELCNVPHTNPPPLRPETIVVHYRDIEVFEHQLILVRQC